MLNFGSSISLSPATEILSGNSLTLTSADKVAGTGNVKYDYVVSFGNGGPKLEPVEFQITGSGLTLGALDLLDTIATNTDKVVNFVVHLQNTATLDGSESLGGLYEPVPTPVTTGHAPEPSSLAVFGLLTSIACAFRWRKLQATA